MVKCHFSYILILSFAVPAKCTVCGGELRVNPSQESAVCQFCGSAFIVSNAVNNYNLNTYHTANEIKKEYAPDQEQKKKRKGTILWILGWIFIFPVPLTILMLRKKEMNQKIKFGIIAAGWIVYLIIMLTSINNNTNGNIESTRNNLNNPVVTTAYTVPKTTKTELSASDIKKLIADGDYSLVTPEFKKMMDDYEAFFDQYINFMKKYASGEGDILSMLTDYTEMLNKEIEWSEKIDAIDESKLSTADDAYFLLVTLRVEKKLLGAF